MEDNTLSQESDVSTESGQPTAETPESSVPDQSGQTQEASAENTEAKLSFNDPKHPDHPRFRELHEQANSYKAELAQARQEREQLQTQYKQMEAYIQQMQAMNQKKADPSYQALVQRLEGIDPEFANEFRQARQVADVVPQLQQQLEEFKTDRLRREATDTLSKLYTDNKVSDDLKPFYERAIKAAVYETETSGKRLSVKDIPNIFKSVHDEHSKFFEDYRRKERASYLSDKKKDASAPASTTGAPAKATSQDKPISREQLKAELVAALRKGKQTI
jgi:hypothetical protein